MRDEDATIEALSAEPARTALLVDFDGSLAPIVERAEDARPLPEAVEALARLATRLGRVAVVSGRPVEFLAAHLRASGLVFAGLYGMQRGGEAGVSVDARVAPYLDAVARATAELLDAVPPSLVEPKAGVSVTLHWRPDPARELELRATAERVAHRHGLALLTTRMAVELRPPVAIDKGDATAELIAGFDVAAFAGDDRGDLPAFAALEHARDRGGLRRAVRIGVRSAEAPPGLEEAVDVMVDGPRGLVALLTRVADEIA